MWAIQRAAPSRTFSSGAFSRRRSVPNDSPVMASRARRSATNIAAAQRSGYICGQREMVCIERCISRAAVFQLTPSIRSSAARTSAASGGGFRMAVTCGIGICRPAECRRSAKTGFTQFCSIKMKEQIIFGIFFQIVFVRLLRSFYDL